MRRGLNAVLKTYTGRQHTNKESVKHSDNPWGQRPLPAYMISYAAQDVQYLVDAYRALKDRLAEHSEWQEEAERRTQANLNERALDDGEAAISRRDAGRMVQDTADSFMSFLETSGAADDGQMEASAARVRSSIGLSAVHCPRPAERHSLGPRPCVPGCASHTSVPDEAAASRRLSTVRSDAWRSTQTRPP